MSITEYVLVAVAALCFLASLILFARAKAEQLSHQQVHEWRPDSDGAQLAPPDRYGFRRMGHCLPWW